MPAAAADAQPLRVLTYNIQGNLNEDISLAAIAGVISAQGPDIVGLQEACANQVDELRTRLTGAGLVHARHVQTVAIDKPHCVGYGIAILSKFPLADYAATELPTHNERRFVQSATIAPGGLPLRFYNTHLSPGAGATHVNAIATETDKPAPERKIVVGDFNVEQDDGALNSLWARSFTEADWSGNTPTHPSGSPSKKIDFVFLGGAVAGGATSVPSTTASDHRPLRADVTLVEPPPRAPTRILYEAGGNVWRAAPDGTSKRQLTTNGGSDPVASPDGSQVAYVSTRDGDAEIFVMSADGEAVSNRQLTHTGTGDWEPTWSPDGVWIAYRTERHVNGDNNNEIYKIRAADGQNDTRLTNNGASDFAPDWSPAGGVIAFQRHTSADGNEIYTMNESGGQVARRTTNDKAHNDGRPSFSPDGSRLAFHSNRNGVSFELFTMNGDGTSVARRTALRGDDQEAVWSPDGTQIAYRSNRTGATTVFTGDMVAGILTSSFAVTAGDSPDWYADLRAPQTTSLDAPSGVTDDATPTFTFARDEAEGSFQCRIGEGTWTACSSPHTTGALAEGERTFSVRAVDWAGNADPTPASRTFTVDSTAPELDVIAQPDAVTNDTEPSVSFEVSGATSVTCAVDGAAPVACSSPFAFAPLDDGPHTLEIRAVDGLARATTATVSFTVDTDPPDTAVTGPSGLIDDATPAFSFSGGSTYACRVDGGGWEACTSPHTVASLGDGPHDFEVRAIDAAGNVDPTPASRSVVVDTVAPVLSVTSAPTPTNSPSLAFSVTGADTVVCAVDGGTFAACSSPFAPSGLDDGSHTLRVRASDAVGHVVEQSATVVVDTSPPVLDVPASLLTNDPTPAIAFGVSGADAVTCAVDGGTPAACTSPVTLDTLGHGAHALAIRAADDAGNAVTSTVAITVDTEAPTLSDLTAPALTNDPTPSVSFDVAGAGAVTCAVDGGAATACASPWSPPALDDGPHTVVVRAADAAGNDVTKSAAITVDTVAPDTTIDGGPAGPTSDATPAFTFSGGDEHQCRVGDGAWTACSSPHTTGALADGDRTFAVRAIDAAGNVDPTPASRSVVVDTVAPVIEVTSAPPALSNDATPSVAFDAGEDGVTFTCAIDGAAAAPCASPHDLGPLADGGHELVISAVDAAGNAATPNTVAFRVDTVAPDTRITSNAEPVVAFEASAGAVAFQCSVDGGAWAVCTSPFAPALAPGTHTIRVRAVDAAGNLEAAPAETVVSIPAPPAPPVPEPPRKPAFVVGFDEYKTAPGASSTSRAAALTLVTKTARPDRRGRLKLVIACRTACRGTLSLGKARKAFRAAAGKRVTVTVTLDTATRAKLRRARRSVDVTVRLAAGVTAPLKLRK